MRLPRSIAAAAIVVLVGCATVPPRPAVDPGSGPEGRKEWDKWQGKGCFMGASSYSAYPPSPRQLSQFHGIVRDEEGRGLASVSFVIAYGYETLYVARSERSGRFALQNLPAGSYWFHTCMDGFCQLQGGFEISPKGADSRLDIVLRPCMKK